MKLIETNGNDFVFQLGKTEKRLLFEVLKFYPLIQASHHQISRSRDPKVIEAHQAHQQLLEEALAAHREENKAQLLAMLNDPSRFREDKSGYRFTLSAYQVEWLLQVLNDVRVGGWLMAGSPDEKQGKPAQVNVKTAPYLWAMEVCGFFQSVLLEALRH